MQKRNLRIFYYFHIVERALILMILMILHDFWNIHKKIKLNIIRYKIFIAFFIFFINYENYKFFNKIIYIWNYLQIFLWNYTQNHLNYVCISNEYRLWIQSNIKYKILIKIKKNNTLGILIIWFSFFGLNFLSLLTNKVFITNMIEL